MAISSTFAALDDEETVVVDLIEIWFSSRRNVWIVERLTSDWRTFGPVFVAQTEYEALECRDVWERAHPGAHLPEPHRGSAAKSASRERRRAA